MGSAEKGDHKDGVRVLGRRRLAELEAALEGVVVRLHRQWDAHVLHNAGVARTAIMRGRGEISASRCSAAICRKHGVWQTGLQ